MMMCPLFISTLLSVSTHNFTQKLRKKDLVVQSGMAERTPKKASFFSNTRTCSILPTIVSAMY